MSMLFYTETHKAENPISALGEVLKGSGIENKISAIAMDSATNMLAAIPHVDNGGLPI